MKRGRLGLIAALAVLGYAGLRGRLRRYEIAENSMQPGLRPGDFVIAQPLTRTPQRGDIVIFEHPSLADFELVKRVVGLPGEHLVIRHGQVHADDAVLAEPWADGPTLPDGDWQLGPTDVFVLGDNRAASAGDSRSIGPIDTDRVRWRVTARYWPVSSVGRIGI